jgi:excisionase family DNA binding protein
MTVAHAPTAVTAPNPTGRVEGRRDVRADTHTKREAIFGTTSPLALTVPPELLEAVAERAAEMLAERLEVGARPEPWLTVDQAAEHLACPKSRIYALVSARRIPHRKDGSRLLFRASELDAWLDQGGGRRP